MPSNLLDFSHDKDGQELDSFSCSIEEIENPSHSHSFNSQYIMFISDISEVSIAPGEGKVPVSLITDFVRNLLFRACSLQEKLVIKLKEI